MNYDIDILIGIFVPNKSKWNHQRPIDSATKDEGEEEGEEEEDILKQKLIIRLMTSIHILII